MKIYIYGLVDPRTEEIRYVGKSARDTRKRLNEHISRSKRKRHHLDNWIQTLLIEDLTPELKILEVATPETWVEREQHWISILPNLTNITKGGEGLHGYQLSLEHKVKIADARKKIVGWNHSEETKRKIGNSHRGRKNGPHSEESNLKRSRTLTGRKFSEEHKNRISKGITGRRLSMDSREKISKSLERLPWPPDEELLEMYKTMSYREIGEALGIKPGSVGFRIRKLKNAG